MKPAFVILAHATDSGAESVARSLVERLGFGAVLIVRPETAQPASWSHRVASTGRATTRLTLPECEPIEDTRVARSSIESDIFRSRVSIAPPPRIATMQAPRCRRSWPVGSPASASESCTSFASIRG